VDAWWISRSVREILFPAIVSVRLREGYMALSEWKRISPRPTVSLHVNSMHLFGDAELEQGLRPQAEVGAALAVWKSLGKALLNYSISRRWKSVTFRYGPGPLIRCAASTIPSRGNDKPNIPGPSSAGWYCFNFNSFNLRSSPATTLWRTKFHRHYFRFYILKMPLRASYQ